MGSIFYLLYVIAYIVLVCWCFTFIILNRRYNWGAFIIFVLIAFTYENFILFLGNKIGEGNLLKNLNYGRYFLHSIITPLLLFFVLSIGKHVGFFKKKWITVGIISLYFLLVAIEIETQLVGLQLVPKWEGEILLYESSNHEKFPWMVAIVSTLLFITSIILWVKKRWIWLFVGVSIMFIGLFLIEPQGKTFIANGLEVILMVSIVSTQYFIVSDS